MNIMRARFRFPALLASIALFAAVSPAANAAHAASFPKPLRLYVLDCGTLHIADTARFSLRADEVTSADLSVACFLIAHPGGALIWDVGAVADADWKPAGEAVVHRLALPDGQTRVVTLRKSLTAQLKACGFAPKDIRFLALSHYHYDHTANANLFAHSTWLVRQNERDAMFADKAPGTTLPASYAGLKQAHTTLIDTDEYDVFGDGSVVIKYAPGHTPGHQMLLVKLAKTGPVLLSGDLYHYPQEIALDRVPTFEFDAVQTRKSRAMITDYIDKTGAHLWIQHDLTANEDLRKAPEFYE